MIFVIDEFKSRFLAQSILLFPTLEVLGGRKFSFGINFSGLFLYNLIFLFLLCVCW